MKLGPAEDGGRKLASAATPNHSDGSKDVSLCSTGNIGIKNEKKKLLVFFFFLKRRFNLPQLLFFTVLTMFCWNKTTNNKQKKGKVSPPSKINMRKIWVVWQKCGWSWLCGCDIFSLWYFHYGKIQPWSYESITRVDGIVPPMNYLRVQSNNADSDSYQKCKYAGAIHIIIWSTASDKMS